MISKEILSNTIKNATSFRDVGRILKISNQTIKRWVLKYNIEYSHFQHGKTYSSKVGMKYNSLTINEIIKAPKRKFLAKCICDCGKETTKRIDSILSGYVISCGCASKNRLSMIAEKNPAFKGIGEISSYYIQKTLRSSKKRNINYNLNKEFLWALYLKQNKKCALSGIPIYFGRVHYSHETNASLDRINSDLHYSEDNVQWVHKDVNKLKHDFNESYFIELCKLISNHKL